MIRTKLPIVMPSNNVPTAIQLESEFPGRMGALLTPTKWIPPVGVPYALDNGRYVAWSQKKEWDEKRFFRLLDNARGFDSPPLWVVVPDKVGDAEGTLKEWDLWSYQLRKYTGWNLAMAVQDGMTVDMVKNVKTRPDVVFVGGTTDWKWKTAGMWCGNFPRVHIGRVGTVNRLWIAHRLGAESTDSNIWRPIGGHLHELRKYLTVSQARPNRKIGFGIGKDQAVYQLEKTTTEIDFMTIMSKVKVKRQHVDVEKKFAAYNGDCVAVMKGIPDESVGLTLYSPPFADLFAYSDSDEDMGNCQGYDEFFKHYGYLVIEHARTMMPGRIVAVHCMDLPTFKSKGEEIGLRDFPGDIVKLFQQNGFVYHARFCIWKDPLVAATRTKAIGLAHKQIVKDSSVCRTGIPDYVLAFRKKGENPKPISHPRGLRDYYGFREVPRDLERFQLDPSKLVEAYEGKKDKRSHWIWQQYASPVWFDIRQSKTLNFRDARESDDQRHICPLQLDVIERCMELWSSRGDIVLDPFGGVGSTGYVAVKNGRKAVMIELKKSYYKQLLRNMSSLSKTSNNGKLLAPLVNEEI